MERVVEPSSVLRVPKVLTPGTAFEFPSAAIIAAEESASELLEDIPIGGTAGRVGGTIITP